MDRTKPSEGYKYTRENGDVETAPDIETVMRLCPIMGKMSLDMAAMAAEMYKAGTDILNEIEKKAAENEPDAEEAGELDPFDMDSFSNELLTSAELFERNFNSLEESETTEPEIEEVFSIVEQPSEKPVENVTVEAKEEVVIEVIESDEVSVPETKSYIEAWTPAEKAKPEIKKDVKDEATQKEIAAIDSIKQPEMTLEVPLIEKSDVTKTSSEKEPATTKIYESVETKPEEESLKDVFIIPTVIQADELLFNTEGGTKTDTPALIVEEDAAKIEVIEIVDSPEDEPAKTAPVLIEPAEPVEAINEIVPPENLSIEDTLPTEKIDDTPAIPELYTEKEFDTKSVLETIHLDLEDEAPAIAAPVISPSIEKVEKIEVIELVQPVEAATDLPEPAIEEQPTQDTPVSIEAEAKTATSEITEAELESIDLKLEAEPEPGATIELTETEPETEKDKLFIKNVGVAEQVVRHEDEEIEYVVTAAQLTTDTQHSKSKARRLIGMFATLLHIQYTPV